MNQTDTLARPHDETTDDPEPTSRRVPIEISVVQLVAGALAAMTAAVIGSRLGISGTVIGAAIGSVVAGVAGSLYTASLQHGRKVIASTPLAVKAGTGRVRPTTELPTHAAVPPGVPTQVSPDRGEVTPKRTGRRRRWKSVLASVAAMFVLAGVGITAVELMTGQSLSGREGTTISQVTQDRPATQSSTSRSSTPEIEQQPAEQSATEAPLVETEPTEEASQTPSQDPTEAATDEAEPTEEAGETPSDVTTDEPTDEPSATPTEEPTEEASSTEATSPMP